MSAKSQRRNPFLSCRESRRDKGSLLDGFLDFVVDQDHEEQEDEGGEAVQNGVLFEEACGQADQDRKKDRECAEDLIAEKRAAGEEYSVEQDEGVVYVDAGKDVGRCVDLVEITDQCATDVVSGDGVRAEIQLRREEE